MNNTNKKCPCENCICIVICKQKSYINLLSECSTLSKYLYNIPQFTKEYQIIRNIDFTNKLSKIHSILKPKSWGHIRSNKQR